MYSAREIAWYRTGRPHARDARGFYYFVDRVGDTYRWKGENVSTTEVLRALGARAGVRDGVVFGVSNAGTATDAPAWRHSWSIRRFDLGAFRAHVGQRLPSYARPVFLRLLPVARDNRNLQAAQAGPACRLDMIRQATTDPLLFR
jgi:fatty-acyl-CoA synthase